ncbi:MAG: ATP-dependent helicase, partial [Pseudohongiellaceae bacterium]
EDIASMPNGLHAVVPADPAKSLEPGVIFALRNRHQGVNVQQQNLLHPYYLVYISVSEEILVTHVQPKQLLDTVRTACKSRNEPVAGVCRAFNKATNDGKNMQVYSHLLNQAIASMIQLKEEKDIDSLFSGDRTSALTGTINGLDDFELVSFLVVY